MVFTITSNKQSSEFYSTGSSSLDKVLGGGILKGQSLFIASEREPEATYIALHISREFVNQGKTFLYLDFNHDVYSSAQAMGLKLSPESSFLFLQPTTLEDFQRIIHQFKDVIDLVVIDNLCGIDRDCNTGKGCNDEQEPFSKQKREIIKQLKEYRLLFSQNDIAFVVIDFQKIKPFVPKKQKLSRQFCYKPELRLMVQRSERQKRSTENPDSKPLFPGKTMLEVWIDGENPVKSELLTCYNEGIVEIPLFNPA